MPPTAAPTYGAPTPPAPPAPGAYGAPAEPAAGAPAPGYGAPAAGYGAPAQPAYGGVYAPATPAKPTPVLSLISLIAGIVGVVGALGVFWIPVVGGIMQLFIPAAAVVLGFLGKKKEPAAKGMWLTGIILGFVGIVFGLLMIVGWVIALATFNSFDYYY